LAAQYRFGKADLVASKQAKRDSIM
jgi:hypothetical protein